MKKHFILVTFLSGLSVLAQQKSASKTNAISSRINIGEQKPRILDAAIKEYPIYFKGFKVTIYDEATDELGNHMLVGRIKALEKDENKRDSFINKAINFSNRFDDDRDIMISTDPNYKMLKVRLTYQTQIVTYNPKLKKFLLGGNSYDHRDIDGRYVGEWQPMITVVDLEQSGATYAIKNNYSCYLKNLIIDEDKIHVLAASEERNGEMIKNQKLEIITVDLNRFHADTKDYLPEILDPVSKIVSEHNDNGRMDVSEILKVGSTYYFSTSNLDQTNVINKTHLYKFDGKKIEDSENFNNYGWEIYHNRDLISFKGFYISPSSEYIFLNSDFMSGKEMYLTKTNNYFFIKKNVKISLYDFVDTSKMVVLPNGNIVIFSLNEKKLWEYSVYNSDLILIKKISSSLSENYYPTKLKIIDEHTVECIFYDGKELKNNSVMQYVKVD